MNREIKLEHSGHSFVYLGDGAVYMDGRWFLDTVEPCVNETDLLAIVEGFDYGDESFEDEEF